MFNGKYGFVLALVMALPCQVFSQTFTNPLLPSGPDPYSFYKDGYYYYTSTLGNRIGIWKTASLGRLPSAEFKVIYTPPPGTPYSKELWAPEILFLQGNWYVYFAADDGNNAHHRLYVLRLEGDDPMTGPWTMKGKLSDRSDKWAIDGDVFTFRNQLYLLWSGWMGDENGEQDVFIAKMSNPWTVSSERACISRPRLAWEMIGDLANQSPSHINVNEGPQALLHGKDLFVIYSASACWTDAYSLGQLRFNGKENLLDSANWVKSTQPVFSQSAANGVYATGHNSFFKSPNGKEDWLLYHANSNPGEGCGKKRSPRAQRFTWNKDGSPHFGEPVRPGEPLPLPAE